MHDLAVQIVRFADDNQPGRIECEFADAEDRSPSLTGIKDSEHFGFGEKVKTAFFGARKQLIGSCIAALAFTFSLSCSAQEFNLMPWPAPNRTAGRIFEAWPTRNVATGRIDLTTSRGKSLQTLTGQMAGHEYPKLLTNSICVFCVLSSLCMSHGASGLFVPN
jgi:hypothetical protein